MSGGLVTSLIARHKLMKIVYNCPSSCSASSLAFWVSAKVYAIACKLFCAILTFVFAVGECQTFLGHFLLDFLFIFLKYRASIVLVSHENHHPISSPSIFSFFFNHSSSSSSIFSWHNIGSLCWSSCGPKV
jgi:hypothetical protein